MRVYIENSMTYAYIARFFNRCSLLKRRIYALYLDSLICRASCGIYEIILNSFKHSILGRATELESVRGPQVVCNESVFIRLLTELYRGVDNRIILYVRASSITSLIDNLRKDLCFSTTKTAGIVMMGAVTANILLVVIFNRGVGLFGWAWRVAFLLISTGWVCSDTGWEKTRQESLIIRWINNHCKNKN